MSLGKDTPSPFQGTRNYPLPLGFLVYTVAVGLALGAAEKPDTGSSVSPSGTTPSPGKAGFGLRCTERREILAVGDVIGYR